ncbi:MAG TPA: MFS transporter [Ilumatobacteraceae bacterium]|nr:MFS transporter [Ilumatobacteraceae bacterium]
MSRGLLDESYAPAVRRAVVPLTGARLATNAVYRFAPPFLATIARGLDVSLADLGVAIAITEAAGLTAPLVGRVIDHVPRRTAMLAGLAGVAAGATIAGLSSGIVMFTVGLLVLAATKVVFDVGIISWTADHVPYDRRGRITGLLETSWALGLLVGVSLLGLVAAATSWRWAYLLGAVGVVVAAGAMRARVALEPAVRAAGTRRVTPAGAIDRPGWIAAVAVLGLMGAAQALFVTFGAWLEDDYGYGTAALSVVTFGIGGLELLASTTSAARTDRWGKERSVVGGTLVMIPCALLLAALHGTLGVALVLLAVFIAAFEFAFVSTIPIGAELVPGAPGKGIGALLASATVGRTIVAIPATRLYDRFGIAAPALLAASFAALAGVAMLVRHHLLATPAPHGGRRRAATARPRMGHR